MRHSKVWKVKIPLLRETGKDNFSDQKKQYLGIYNQIGYFRLNEENHTYTFYHHQYGLCLAINPKSED